MKNEMVVRNDGISPNFNLGDIDTFEKDNTIWFCLSDVGKALELDRRVISNWVNEYKWFDNDEIESIKNRQGGHNKIYIAESALYRVLNKTNSPKAKPFERWVTKEVIPNFKKTNAIEQNIIRQENNYMFHVGDVNVRDINGVLWFRAADIAKCIEYTKPENWDRWLDKDEIVFLQIEGIDKPMKFVSESGLYRILIKTNVPKAKPFERWVTKEVIPSIRKTGSYTNPQAKIEEKPYVTRVESAKLLREIGLEYQGKSETYKQILDAYAVKEIIGEFVLPLPQTERKTYSATEIGEMLGVSAQKIGSIANRLHIKTDEYGQYFIDKAKHTNKEVEVFRYYDNAITKIKQELNA